MALLTVAPQKSPSPTSWQVGSALLGRPSSGSHIVQFYQNDEFLVDAVVQYAAAGLAADEPVIVVATPAHREAIRRALIASGFDLDSAGSGHHAVFLDAGETLSRFMVGGLPNPDLFANIVGQLLDGLRVVARGAGIRAFGEMVDLLWRAGNREGAIQLEQLWNDISRRYTLSLLCGYVMDSFRQGEQTAVLFEQVCAAHSHVIPTEAYSRLEDDEARLREVTLLQQKAGALEEEIARRKDVERTLREALSVRDEFLAIASHELKTPLTTIHLQVQSLLRLNKNVDEPRIAQRLSRAARNIDRITSLVEQLLDVSRISASRLTLDTHAVDLLQTVMDVVAQVTEGRARGSASVSISGNGPLIGQWDSVRLEQVIVNLLTNALKYGRGQGVNVTVERVGDLARLSVRDFGIGIAEQDHRRIFERFERAVPAEHYGGLGLGLWIVKCLVDAHGGTVTVDSALGAGATFVVDLPLRN